MSFWDDIKNFAQPYTDEEFADEPLVEPVPADVDFNLPFGRRAEESDVASSSSGVITIERVREIYKDLDQYLSGKVVFDNVKVRDLIVECAGLEDDSDVISSMYRIDVIYEVLIKAWFNVSKLYPGEDLISLLRDDAKLLAENLSNTIIFFDEDFDYKTFVFEKKAGDKIEITYSDLFEKIFEKENEGLNDDKWLDFFNDLLFSEGEKKEINYTISFLTSLFDIFSQDAFWENEKIKELELPVTFQDTLFNALHCAMFTAKKLKIEGDQPIRRRPVNPPVSFNNMPIEVNVRQVILNYCCIHEFPEFKFKEDESDFAIEKEFLISFPKVVKAVCYNPSYGDDFDNILGMFKLGDIIKICDSLLGCEELYKTTSFYTTIKCYRELAVKAMEYINSSEDAIQQYGDLLGNSFSDVKVVYDELHSQTIGMSYFGENGKLRSYSYDRMMAFDDITPFIDLDPDAESVDEAEYISLLSRISAKYDFYLGDSEDSMKELAQCVPTSEFEANLKRLLKDMDTIIVNTHKELVNGRFDISNKGSIYNVGAVDKDSSISNDGILRTDFKELAKSRDYLKNFLKRLKHKDSFRVLEDKIPENKRIKLDYKKLTKYAISAFEPKKLLKAQLRRLGIKATGAVAGLVVGGAVALVCPPALSIVPTVLSGVKLATSAISLALRAASVWRTVDKLTASKFRGGKVTKITKFMDDYKVLERARIVHSLNSALNAASATYLIGSAFKDGTVVNELLSNVFSKFEQGNLVEVDGKNLIGAQLIDKDGVDGFDHVMYNGTEIPIDANGLLEGVVGSQKVYDLDNNGFVDGWRSVDKDGIVSHLLGFKPEDKLVDSLDPEKIEVVLNDGQNILFKHDGTLQSFVYDTGEYTQSANSFFTNCSPEIFNKVGISWDSESKIPSLVDKKGNVLIPNTCADDSLLDFTWKNGKINSVSYLNEEGSVEKTIVDIGGTGFGEDDVTYNGMGITQLKFDGFISRQDDGSYIEGSGDALADSEFYLGKELDESVMEPVDGLPGYYNDGNVMLNFGDVDGDKIPDIVYKPTSDGYVVGYDRDGDGILDGTQKGENLETLIAEATKKVSSESIVPDAGTPLFQHGSGLLGKDISDIETKYGVDFEPVEGSENLFIVADGDSTFKYFVDDDGNVVAVTKVFSDGARTWIDSDGDGRVDPTGTFETDISSLIKNGSITVTDGEISIVTPEVNVGLGDTVDTPDEIETILAEIGSETPTSEQDGVCYYDVNGETIGVIKLKDGSSTILRNVGDQGQVITVPADGELSIKNFGSKLSVETVKDDSGAIIGYSYDGDKTTAEILLTSPEDVTDVHSMGNEDALSEFFGVSPEKVVYTNSSDSLGSDGLVDTYNFKINNEEGCCLDLDGDGQPDFMLSGKVVSDDGTISYRNLWKFNTEKGEFESVNGNAFTVIADDNGVKFTAEGEYVHTFLGNEDAPEAPTVEGDTSLNTGGVTSSPEGDASLNTDGGHPTLGGGAPSDTDFESIDISNKDSFDAAIQALRDKGLDDVADEYEARYHDVLATGDPVKITELYNNVEKNLTDNGILGNGTDETQWDIIKNANWQEHAQQGTGYNFTGSGVITEGHRDSYAAVAGTDAHSLITGLGLQDSLGFDRLGIQGADGTRMYFDNAFDMESYFAEQGLDLKDVFEQYQVFGSVSRIEDGKPVGYYAWVDETTVRNMLEYMAKVGVSGKGR